ncbi:hypothetical protein [Pandoraea communis]|uniref:hypothetical protein n=1 Tax=Pandoraea communis TaxID=2508297 RepID=UPI0025A550AE|nr:hypothetical protein [Pandoraea communis]MDM8354965.1 hypothetical protein [Pandoraea communis]
MSPFNAAAIAAASCGAIAGRSEGTSMRRKQSGIFLISAGIAVAVTGMLITFWGVNYTRQLRAERAERIGESLKIMGDATQSFAVAYHDRLNKLFEKNEPFVIGDVQFTREGTAPRVVGNLTAENLLKVMNVRGVASRPPNGMGEYAIQVYEDCVNNQCDIKTLVYLTQPIKRAYSEAPDFDAAATAMRKIGALGGMSRQDAPGQFHFLDNNGSERLVANPAAQPGLIAVRGGHQTSAMDTLLSLDGRKSMTGNLNLEDRNGGANGAATRHNIVGAGNIEGSGALAMNSLAVNSARIAGTLDLSSNKKDDDQKTGSSIIGARDITGSGTLSMGGVNADRVKVGTTLSLNANDITGARNVDAKSVDATNVEATRVKAERVESAALKSTDGVVELGTSISGGSCTGMGIGVDAQGRVMSCQQEDPKGNGRGARVWKLSSPTVTRDNVPDNVVDKITSEVQRNSSWWMSRFDLRWGKSKLLHRGAASVLYEVGSPATACVLDAEAISAGGILEYNHRLDRFVVRAMGRPAGALYCFSYGSGSVGMRTTFWDWGKNNVGHGIMENPTWYRDNTPEFRNLFKATMTQNIGALNEGGNWHH